MPLQPIQIIENPSWIDQNEMLKEAVRRMNIITGNGKVITTDDENGRIDFSNTNWTIAVPAQGDCTECEEALEEANETIEELEGEVSGLEGEVSGLEGFINDNFPAVGNAINFTFVKYGAVYTGAMTLTTFTAPYTYAFSYTYSWTASTGPAGGIGVDFMTDNGQNQKSATFLIDPVGGSSSGSISFTITNWPAKLSEWIRPTSDQYGPTGNDVLCTYYLTAGVPSLAPT